MENATGPVRPAWWSANVSLRDSMGLPTYEPPRFEDGTYTHEIVYHLEREYDCSILFIGVNTRYLDDWEVRVDGEPTFTVGRHRDENGNTVYELDAAEFQKWFRSCVDPP